MLIVYAAAAGDDGSHVGHLQGEEFSMVLLVPRFRDTLLSLISELSSSHVQTIINQLGELNRQLVDLKMPKFDIETRTSLAPALRDVIIPIIGVVTISLSGPLCPSNHRENDRFVSGVSLCVLYRWAWDASSMQIPRSWSTSMKAGVMEWPWMTAFIVQHWPWTSKGRLQRPPMRSR